MVYTAGLYARERREATIPRTRNARTRAYISTVSHSLSSGKFIRANIRDAVKVTLFNVHPLRETSVHTPCAARRRPTRPLSTSFQTTTRFFNSLEKRPRATAFSPLFLPPLSRFAPICAEQPTFHRDRGFLEESKRENSNRGRSKETAMEEGGRDERIESKVGRSNSRDGLLRRVVPREERPTYATPHHSSHKRNNSQRSKGVARAWHARKCSYK